MDWYWPRESRAVLVDCGSGPKAGSSNGTSALQSEAVPPEPKERETSTVKAKQEVIDLLNEVLAGELVAINQYFLHAKMCKNWGYLRIAEHDRAESIDEMKHADQVIERILFLEGLPNLQRLDKLAIGQTVPEQFKCDLDLEYRAVKRLNDGIRLCRELGDNATDDFLTKILVDEEEHVDWLETQLGIIEKIGENAYLAEQLHES